ncbi:transposase domain-containing protein [Streptomyces sp. NRRL F-2664]|uniref:transposase domain-containing protein n=1 Tax=Streptomyces sp. NRRL F-2664 TaxID=1463842 RepID=UPI00131ECAC3
MADEVLAESGRTQQRIRLFPTRGGVPALAGALLPGPGWQEVRQRMTSGLEGVEAAAPTAGAWAQGHKEDRGHGRCGACPTCCAGRPQGPALWERGGAACSSARSAAP